MSDFEVFELRESFVEVLGQEEHLLGDVEDVAFFHLALLDESFDNGRTDEFLPLELLANLECHVDRAYG